MLLLVYRRMRMDVMELVERAYRNTARLEDEAWGSR